MHPSASNCIPRRISGLQAVLKHSGAARRTEFQNELTPEPSPLEAAFSLPGPWGQGSMSLTGILHQVQGEHSIARLAAMIFRLQIARAQVYKNSSLHPMVRSQVIRHTTLWTASISGFHILV